MTLQILYRVSRASAWLESKQVTVATRKAAHDEVLLMLQVGYRDITAELVDAEGEVVSSYSEGRWTR